MKKCPFCAEQIQEEAVKCRTCGEKLGAARQGAWYFKSSFLIVAFLCVGPLALPLLWFNPHFAPKKKIVISVIVLAASFYLGILIKASLREISSYYQMVF